VAILALVLALASSLSELTSEAQLMIVTDGISDILHAQSITVDPEYYEITSYNDTLYRAHEEAPYRPTCIFNGLVQSGDIYGRQQSSMVFFGKRYIRFR
jgi:ATP-binding cassette, subfamily B, bacterial